MEIQKVFSNIEDPEENLYSVLMTEEEVALYSESKDHTTRNGALIVGGGLVGNTILGKKVMDNFDRPISEEEGKVANKLVENAKKRGINVVEHGAGIPGPAYGKGVVYRNHTKDAGSLAHEIGHAYYDREKKAGKIGKVAHKAYLKTGGSIGGATIPGLAGIASGIYSGKAKAKREKEGKKEGKISKHSGWAVPVALSAPMLVSEAAASRKGIKLLKQSGASKKVIKDAKKNLSGAFGTYATQVAANAGVGQIAKGIAYKREKKKSQN